jgi:two-component system, NarL family, nitrate/nitrite response regulator NarL
MPPRCHVVVTSDQSLVADSVGAALRGPELTVTRPDWRALLEARLPTPRIEPVDVGVLLCDLHPMARLAEAQVIVQEVRLPWLLLTGARPGPAWGAMLDAGAVAVLPSTCTLDQLRAAIPRLSAGEPVMDRQVASQLRAAWRGVEHDRRLALDQMRSLTPRETVVLGFLYAGEPVRQIAARLGVTQATVRTQVRGILRKLDVRSQLAAVAAYAAAQGDGLPDGDSAI